MSPEVLVLLVLLAARAGWIVMGRDGSVRRFVAPVWPTEAPEAPTKPASQFWPKLYAIGTVVAFGFGSLYVLLRFVKWAWSE